jgi:hypothetical protein
VIRPAGAIWVITPPKSPQTRRTAGPVAAAERIDSAAPTITCRIGSPARPEPSVLSFIHLYGDARPPAERGAAAERIAVPRLASPLPDGSPCVARAKRRAAAPLGRWSCVTGLELSDARQPRSAGGRASPSTAAPLGRWSCVTGLELSDARQPRSAGGRASPGRELSDLRHQWLPAGFQTVDDVCGIV